MPFVRRRPFVEERPFVERGGHSPRGEETVHRGREFVERCLSMWWEGRTMNFHIGKFKIQHDRTMSEFERTSMNCSSQLDVVHLPVAVQRFNGIRDSAKIEKYIQV